MNYDNEDWDTWHKKKKIYSLVEWLTDKKIRILSRKWVYLIKVNENDEILKYKVCWMIQKFHQQKKINYSKIYISVIVRSSICMIFAVAAVKKWHVQQIDFITIFLNKLLHDNMHMIQSIEFEEEKRKEKNLICKLNQNLYELKQSF